MVMMCEPRTVLSAGLCSASSDRARSEGCRGSGCSAKPLIHDPTTEWMEVGASASSTWSLPTEISGMKKQGPNQSREPGVGFQRCQEGARHTT